MLTARLAGEALEHERVVLRPGDVLDDAEPACERDVGERRLGGVVPLEEEHELGLHVVQEALGRDRRLERPRQELGELVADALVAKVDRSLVECTRDGREHVAADCRAVEGQVADAGERRPPGQDLLRGGRGLGAGCVVEVRRERHEALDPEGGEVLARHPRLVLDDHDRPPPHELERLAEHPFELQLVDELGQADEERDRAVAVPDRAQAGMLSAQARDVALEDRPAANAFREGREGGHAAGTASAK